jgi:cystathionine beta-synthase
MKYFDSILDLVGDTPLVRLNNIVEPDMATVFAKMETLNPTGSVKDRMAVNMVKRAEEAGLLMPGGTIVESTSGNTGLGLAMAAAAKGYHCIFTIPDKMSQEKIDMLKAYGAEVIVTPTDLDHHHPDSYVEVAKRIASNTKGALYTDQYSNMHNPEAHYLTTGPEIWEATDGKIDSLVAGLGTGGTISGAGKYLKEKARETGRTVRVVGPDPYGSIYKEAFETGVWNKPSLYRVEGIGHDFMVDTLDFSVIDEVVNVSDRDSFFMARKLARQEGIFSGGSTGTVFHGALKEAQSLGPGKIVVAVVCDSGDRYISKVFNDEWMRDMGYFAPDAHLGTVQELLDFHTRPVVFSDPDESLQDVIGRMASLGISQMPMTDGQGGLRMIEELDILRAVAGGEHSLENHARDIARPLDGQIGLGQTLDQVHEIFEQNNVAVVVDQGQILGVINKIDLLEFLTHHQRTSDATGPGPRKGEQH